MINSPQSSDRVRFGDFEVNLRTGEVRKHGYKIRLQEKSFQILSLLLERAGEIVTREELQQRLWPADTFIDFNENLNTNLNRLRQALGDPANEQNLIKTIPRRGYRFIAPVNWIEAGAEGTAPQTESVPVAATQELPETVRHRPYQVPSRPQLITVAVLFAVMVVGFVAYIRWLSRPAEAGRALHRNTILVTPFQDLSGDASQDYLSDGLTDEMITRLGGMSPGQLSVIARSTAMQYKNTHKTVGQLAAEQHVDYVLEGSFRRQGDHVRITAQLYNARSQQSLWTEAYERSETDLLAIQREVADRIAQSLSLELLSPASRPSAEAHPVNPESYDAYLKGLYELNERTPAGLEKSIRYFSLATDKDPQFGPAYAGLAYSYNVVAGWTYASPQEAYPKAKAAAQKALAIDATLADAHFANAEVLHEYDWDWSAAEQEYLRGLELNPSSAVGHKLYAEYLTHAARFQEAMAEIRKAQQLDPASMVTNSFVCFGYLHAREFDKAIKECRKDLELDPKFVPALNWLADAYVFTGRFREAEAALKKALELSGNANYFLTGLAMTSAYAGDKSEARKILGELKLRAGQMYVSPFGLADIHIALGDREQALAMLEQGLQDRSADMIFVATAPEFDSLHGDSRFQAILTRIGFPESAQNFPASKQSSPR